MVAKTVPMLLWWLTLLAEAARGLEIQTVRVPKYAKVGRRE